MTKISIKTNFLTTISILTVLMIYRSQGVDPTSYKSGTTVFIFIFLTYVTYKTICPMIKVLLSYRHKQCLKDPLFLKHAPTILKDKLTTVSSYKYVSIFIITVWLLVGKSILKITTYELSFLFLIPAYIYVIVKFDQINKFIDGRVAQKNKRQSLLNMFRKSSSTTSIKFEIFLVTLALLIASEYLSNDADANFYAEAVYSFIVAELLIQAFNRIFTKDNG